MKKIVSAIIITATGLVTLAGYLFREALSPVLALFTDWAILLIGIAGILGHWLSASNAHLTCRKKAKR